MKRWFDIKANAAEKSAQIKIFGHIGGAVTASYFHWELEDLKMQGVNDLTVVFNSGGGSMFDGNMIYNLLKAFPGKKTGVVIGTAASMASLIFEACDTRIMAPNAHLMIHNPTLSMDSIGVEEMDGLKNLLSSMRDQMGTVYSARSGKKKDEVMQLMAVTTWFNAQQAVDAGFADEVREFDEAPEDTDYDLSAYGYKNIPTCLLQNFPNTEMTGPNKGPESSAQGGTAHTPDVNALMDQNEKMAQELRELREKGAKEKAELLVDGAISQGKIHASSRDSYLSLAVKDPDSVKQIFEGIKPAQTISSQIKAEGGEGGGAGADVRAGWSFNDWSKKDSDGLLKMKHNQPETYAKLYDEQFKKK